MPQRLLALPLVLITVALIAAACGGGDDSDAPLVDDAPAQTAPEPADQAVAAPQPGADDAEPATLDADRPSAPNDPLDADDDPPANTAGSEYTVQAGDALWSIALQFDTTVDALIALNSLTNPDALTVGQVLRIPGSGDPEAQSEDDAEIGTDEGDNESDADSTDGDAPADDGTDDDAAAADDAPAQTTTPPPPSGTVVGANPGTIPQPNPDTTVSEIPIRPTNLADFGSAALPWLQDRIEIDDILPLFAAWQMPATAGGDRLNFVDTDADGLPSLLIVYTDPAAIGQPLTPSNLIIYDPVPGRSGRYQIAYDHQLASGGIKDNVAVLNPFTLRDVTGDGYWDIAFTEQICGASTCSTSLHVLVREGDGYRDIVVTPIEIPSAHSLAFDDQTGDGLPDISITGGLFASVGADPQREFRFVFGHVNGAFRQISQTGLDTNWLVWIITEGNEAFDAADYARAITSYDRAATDPALEEWFDGERQELTAFAHLRRALSLALRDDPTAALSAAQAAGAGNGLVADLSDAFLTGFAPGADVAAGCSAFNNALALRVADWDDLWARYGYAVPRLQAEQICPF